MYESLSRICPGLAVAALWSYHLVHITLLTVSHLRKRG